RLGVRAGPLHRDLERALGALGLEEDDVPVKGLPALVQVVDEVDDAALVAELHLPALAPLVDEAHEKAAREKGGLAEALGQRVEVELRLLEDVGVGQERDRRARRLRGLAPLDAAGGLPERVAL